MLVDLYDAFAEQSGVALKRLPTRRPAGALMPFSAGLPPVAEYEGVNIRLLSFVDTSVTPPRAYVRMAQPGSDSVAWFELTELRELKEMQLTRGAAKVKV